MHSRYLVTCALAAALLAGCSKSPQQYYESGNRYYAQKKYNEALVEYRNAIQKDPRFGNARLKAAECFERLDQPEAAYQQYIRAADLLPANVEAQLKATAYLLMGRKYEDARTKAESILKKDPKNARAQVLLGNAMAGLNDLDGAIGELEEAVQLNPNEGAAYTNLGILQQSKGNVAAAERAYKQAVAVDPKSVEAQTALGYFYWSSGRTAEAEACLKAGHAIDPKNLLANRAIATFYVASNRAAEAEPYYKAIADVGKDVKAGLNLADYYTRLHRNAEAMTLLQKLAATKDGYGQASIRIAGLQYSDGKKAEAYKTLEQVLAKEPKNDGALVVKARFLANEHRLDEALASAKAGAAANPRSVNAHYLVGVIQASKNNLEEATTSFKEVLKLNPRAVAAQLAISQLELLRGAAGARGAAEYAQQALAADPGNAIAHVMLFRSLLMQGDLARAETEVRSLERSYPNAAATHSSLGMLQMRKRELPAARASFEKALKLEPASHEALAGLVALDLAEKRPGNARARIDARLAAAPNDAAALILSARVLAVAGDSPGAERALLKTIEVAPDNLEAYGLLGRLYIEQGKLDQARNKFEELARRQPKPVAAHTMIAMILGLQGKKAESQKRYEKVLEIDPRAPVAANNLAWRYSEDGGNLDVALQLAQTAKAGLPDSPEVNDTLGWIYTKKDMAGLAIAPLTQAVARDPKNAGYQYHLGAAYAKAGDKAHAKASLETALKLSPTFEGAADAKKMLDSLK